MVAEVRFKLCYWKLYSTDVLSKFEGKDYKSSSGVLLTGTLGGVSSSRTLGFSKTSLNIDLWWMNLIADIFLINKLIFINLQLERRNLVTLSWLQYLNVDDHTGIVKKKTLSNSSKLQRGLFKSNYLSMVSSSVTDIT